MDFRKSLGEEIKDNSPLICDRLPESNIKYRAKWGLATSSKLLRADGIKKALDKAVWAQGLRSPLTEGKTAMNGN
jgi:hypothetical protein